jgi:cytochrome c biogenesis protein CcmG/thiol:disulfide interchange protein DsbE
LDNGVDMQQRATPRAATAAICLALIVLAAGCGGSGKGPTGGPSGPLLPSSATALPRMDPATFQALLTELRGKPVVVNIWASWCGPCRQEGPELAAVSRAHQGQVQFVGVDIEDQVGLARKFIEQYGWTYPSVFDSTGAIRDSLGLIGQPDTLVFDAAGRRSFVSSGAITRQVLESAISKALQRGASSTTSPMGY